MTTTTIAKDYVLARGILFLASISQPDLPVMIWRDGWQPTAVSLTALRSMCPTRVVEAEEAQLILSTMTYRDRWLSLVQ